MDKGQRTEENKILDKSKCQNKTDIILKAINIRKEKNELTAVENENLHKSSLEEKIISLELAREKFRILALEESKKLYYPKNQKFYKLPPLEFEITRIIRKYKKPKIKVKKYREYKKLHRKPFQSVKIECSNENVKSFNDFDEGIFVINPDTNKYKCPLKECNKEFPSLSRIKRHYIIHTDIKPFKCKNKCCHRRFSRKDNMLQHYRTHCPYNTTKNT